MILLANFIFFLLMDTVPPMNNQIKCGKYPIESLTKQMFYRSYKSKETFAVKVNGENDFSGSFGRVSIGYIVQDGNVRCVAVKLMDDQFGHYKYFTKSRDVMDKIQSLLAINERQHLVEMIDAGDIIHYTTGLIIMEMGEETFHDRLYRRADHYESDQQLMMAIDQLAQPLNEFHRVAIHMDVNPKNYLYVIDKNSGQMVLKLIDFDGAQFVESLSKNAFVEAKGELFTPEYTGPEFYADFFRFISPKFDIWSIGIMTFEILIDQLRSERGNDPLYEHNRKTILSEVGNLHMGFERNTSGEFPGSFREKPILYFKKRTNWIGKYKDAIFMVLQLWLKYPKTAPLVTNMLHPLPEERPTMKGILDFLGDLCKPAEFLEADSVKKIRIFNSVNFSEFKRIIRIFKFVNRLAIRRIDRREMKAKFGLMRQMLGQIMEEQQTQMEELQKEGMVLRSCEKD